MFFPVGNEVGKCINRKQQRFNECDWDGAMLSGSIQSAEEARKSL